MNELIDIEILLLKQSLKIFSSHCDGIFTHLFFKHIVVHDSSTLGNLFCSLKHVARDHSNSNVSLTSFVTIGHISDGCGSILLNDIILEGKGAHVFEILFQVSSEILGLKHFVLLVLTNLLKFSLIIF